MGILLTGTAGMLNCMSQDEEDHLTVSFLLPYFFTVIFSSWFLAISMLDLLKTGAFTTLT